MAVPCPGCREDDEAGRAAIAPCWRSSASLLPDREQYTRTWGSILESAGVTLGLGLLAGLCAYRVWPAGMIEISSIFLLPEFLEDPLLLAGVFVLSTVPSAIWILLHPWIDARRIDRNPLLEHRITRDYRRLLGAGAVMHVVAFLAAAGVGTRALDPVPPPLRMPVTLAVYFLTHGILHLVRNRWGFVFSRQANLNVQSHLHALWRTDPPRFQDTIRILGAVSAFNNRMGDRIGLILDGTEYVSPEALLKGLDFLILTFPPKGGLESILKLGSPDKLSHYRSVVDEFLAILKSRTPVSAGPTPENQVMRLLSGARRDRPIQVLCACLHNHNRSPAMEAALRWLLRRKGLTSNVTVDSGGIAPIAKASSQLMTALKRKGIDVQLDRPQSISDEMLRAAHLVLAADVPTALALGLRLKRLEPSSEAPEKIVLFTSLDRARFKGRDNLPDPYSDRVTIREVLDQVCEVLERVLLPILATTTIPESLIALAGRLMRGFFPGDLPPYQFQKRMRLVIAIARNDPGYLIHIDRGNYRNHELPPEDVSFVWDSHRVFNELFLAQLCDRSADRKLILEQSPHGKDYSNSVVALHSLLSPALHRIAKARQGVSV